MTTPRTVETYGGPFLDKFSVEDPTTEQSSALYNRHAEDTAQMSRTTDKAVVVFPTTTDAGPVAVDPERGQSHAGTGVGALPTITKTATGRYTVTFPESFVDGLGETEVTSFSYSAGRVKHLTTAGQVQTTEAANVISVAVFDMAGAASDLGGILLEVDAR